MLSKNDTDRKQIKTTCLGRFRGRHSDANITHRVEENKRRSKSTERQLKTYSQKQLGVQRKQITSDLGVPTNGPTSAAAAQSKQQTSDKCHR